MNYQQIIEQHTVFLVGVDWNYVDSESTNKFDYSDIGFDNIKSLELVEQYRTNTSASEPTFIIFTYNPTMISEYKIKYTLVKNNIQMSPININSVHLIRILGINKITNYNLELDIEFDYNQFPDILMEISNLLSQDISNNKMDLMDYCSICAQPLNIGGLNVRGMGKIQCCDNEICNIKSKICVMDSRIIDNYNKDPFMTELMVIVLLNGVYHPKKDSIFKPMPILPDITDLGQLIKLLEHENKNNNLNISHIESNKNFSDIELYRRIGSNAYGIINNAISGNYFSMNTIVNFVNTAIDLQRLKLSIEKSIFECEQVKFIGFNYSFEIERTFKKKHYLFHGSVTHSWYPIIKNGLKVMSGTEFQANGAVYGKGVYFSDSFDMSLSYSRHYNSKSNKGSEIPTKTIVGIFEINDDINKYEKTTNIYVVDKEEIMLLRYLVVIEPNFTSSFREITEYFFKFLPSLNSSHEKTSKNIKNKRLITEMKLLKANPNVHNVEMIDEITEWEITLLNIKEHNIKIKVYFNEYPKLPPKLLIQSTIPPVILPSNSDDMIFLPELKPSHWNLTMNLSKIVDTIYNHVLNNI